MKVLSFTSMSVTPSQISWVTEGMWLCVLPWYPVSLSPSLPSFSFTPPPPHIPFSPFPSLSCLLSLWQHFILSSGLPMRSSGHSGRAEFWYSKPEEREPRVSHHTELSGLRTCQGGHIVSADWFSACDGGLCSFHQSSSGIYTYSSVNGHPWTTHGI